MARHPRAPRERAEAGRRVVVAGPGGQVQRVVEELDDMERGSELARHVREALGDDDVELAQAQQRDAVLRLGVADVDVQARVGEHRRGHPRQHGAGERRERRDAQGAGDLGGRRVQVGLGALELGEHRVGVGDERPAGIGQREPPSLALEQHHAGLALQRRELLGDGRRRERQRLGGRGDGAALGELAQDPEALDVERHVKRSYGSVKKTSLELNDPDHEDC